MTARPWRDLCPDADYRDTLTEAEFWERVTQGITLPLYQETDPAEDYYDGPDLDAALSPQPCSTCGSLGACGYDSEGRPMIHTTEDDDT